MVKRIDWKNAIATIALISLSFIGYLFRTELLVLIKSFFEFEELTVFSGGLATIFTITHKLKTRKIKFSPSMSFNEFRIPLEDTLSFVSNPITIACSISLAKGIFLQTTDGENYFPLFGKIEITFIGLVTAYLLFISIMELYRNIMETFLVTSTERTPKAIPESEVKQKIPDPD